MFDDLETAESKTEEAKGPPDDEQERHWWIGPWAHVIAGVAFCLIYFPLHQRNWAWQVSVTLAYIIFMLCCTCGMSFKDADDFFGNLQVPRYMGGLLVRQVLILALVSLGLYLWRYCEAVLPAWVTYEGRRMSLWDYFGIIVVYIVAVREASWMTKKIKAQFAESEGSD